MVKIQMVFNKNTQLYILGCKKEGLGLRHSLSPRRRGPCRKQTWSFAPFFYAKNPLLEQALRGFFTQKNRMIFIIRSVFCGERGIRTPEPVKVNGFQDRRIRPLCHLSNSLLGLQK